MKLKALAALCKKNGRFNIRDHTSEEGELTDQWLGTSSALYPLGELSYIDENSICILFDISEKQHEKLLFTHGGLPEHINFNDTDTLEKLVENERISIGYSDYVLRPMFTDDGIKFIDVDCLTPLADMADTLEFYECKTLNGGTYFAAKNGFMLVGIIMPFGAMKEEFVRKIEGIARKCRFAYDMEEQTRRAASIDELQTNINQEESSI
jgi:hypothetical protein